MCIPIIFNVEAVNSQNEGSVRAARGGGVRSCNDSWKANEQKLPRASWERASERGGSVKTTHRRGDAERTAVVCPRLRRGCAEGPRAEADRAAVAAAAAAAGERPRARAEASRGRGARAAAVTSRQLKSSQNRLLGNGAF